MMKKSIVVSLVVTIVLSMMAFTGRAEAQDFEPSTKAPKDQLYIEVSALSSLDYFYDHKLGMKQVGEDLGVKTEYVGPSDYDMNAVAAAMDQAIVKQAEGIVIVGWEDSLIGSIDKAIEAGIPVVTVDADLAASKRIAFVGTSNFNCGVEGGKYVSELLGGKGKVALLGMPTLSNIRARIEGYKSVFATNDIEIVQIGDSKTDSVGAAETVAGILLKYPDLDAMICVDSHGGVGAATAVKEAGKAGKILVIGMDRDNTLLEFIVEGVVKATIVQRTALMPYYATLLLYQMRNNPVPITDDDKAAGALNIPTFIDTGVMIVDKSGAQHFIRK